MSMSLNFYLQEVFHQEKLWSYKTMAAWWGEYLECGFIDDFEDKVLVLVGNPFEMLP